MPGSGNRGDRGDGTSGGARAGGGASGGMGGPGRDTVSAYGGGWARMGNFRGDPGLGGGGAYGFSGINSLTAAMAAQAQNPTQAQMSGLTAAIAQGRFGAPMANAQARRDGSYASSTTAPAPPTMMPPSVITAPLPAPPATPPTTLRPAPNYGIPGLPPAPPGSVPAGTPTGMPSTPQQFRGWQTANPGFPAGPPAPGYYGPRNPSPNELGDVPTSVGGLLSGALKSQSRYGDDDANSINRGDRRGFNGPTAGNFGGGQMAGRGRGY